MRDIGMGSRDRRVTSVRLSLRKRPRALAAGEGSDFTQLIAHNAALRTSLTCTLPVRALNACHADFVVLVPRAPTLLLREPMFGIRPPGCD